MGTLLAFVSTAVMTFFFPKNPPPNGAVPAK